MSVRSFELRVIPLDSPVAAQHGAGEYGLALNQTTPLPHPEGARGSARVRGEEPRPLVRIWGTTFRAIVDRVLAALKDNGYRASELSRTRKAPFLLSEESGVRLGLLFLAAKPLRKLSRMEAISNAIWAMSPEEAYYWFSKCTDGATGRRARRALRLLLATE